MDNKSSTPPIGSNIQLSSASVEQPSSPLERLDPQRLRDQAVASHLGQHALPGHWSPSNLSIHSPIRTPQSVHSPLPVSTQQRHSSGSVESLQQFTNQQFFSSNEAGYSQEFNSPQNARTQIIQSQSPSTIIAGQIGSPRPVSSLSGPGHSSNSGTASQLGKIQQQQQPQYKMMTINGQTVYATVPPTPGTPTATPRAAYQIQPGNQFQFPQSQQPHQGQQNQQWIAIQPQQMQFSGQPRIITQSIQRNVNQKFPSGVPQGAMIYASNMPNSSVPQRIVLRQQVITTQSQHQNPTLQGLQTPGTPTTPLNHQASVPPPQTNLGPIAGGYYPSQGFPPNYPQNGGQVNYTPQRQPMSVQPASVGQFVPTNNVHENLQGTLPPQLAPNPYSPLPTINNGQQKPNGSVPQQRSQIPASHFHNSQAPVNKQAGDMRSPTIISPNQTVSVNAAPLMQPHNMNQHAPRPQQSQLVRMTQQFYVPEPQNNIPPELCFAGCYFLYAENRVMHGDFHNLVKAIRYFGGEMEFYSTRAAVDKATHIICDYAAHVPQDLLQKNKRVCTISWISDVIERKRVELPFKVCHLPSFVLRNSAITEKVISITGFSENESTKIKLMIVVIGARFSPFLSKYTSVLIAKSPNSPKVEKALNAFSNTAQICNFNWLCDLYLGSLTPLTEPSNRRFNINTPASFEIGPLNLSKINENTSKLMVSWKYPVPVTEEHLKRAKEKKNQMLNDDTTFPAVKYFKIFHDDIIPSEERIQVAMKMLKEKGCKPELKVLFTGFDNKEKDILSKKIAMLGVDVVDQVEQCEIVVAPFLVRSASILKAIAAGKDIISPLWISTCFNHLQLVNSDDFVLRDVTAEKVFGCNLRHTLIESRLQPIFENICFYVSPSVKPSRNELHAIIEAGGGTIDRCQPSRFSLQKYLDEDRLYIIISSQCDLDFFHAFTEKKIPIFSEELIFCAVMRHKMDTTHFFAINVAPTNRTGIVPAPAKPPVTPIQKMP